MEVLIFVGVFLVLGAYLFLLANAFGTSVWWGLAVLFVPLAPLVFFLTHWNRSWKPLLVALFGAVFIVIAVLPK